MPRLDHLPPFEMQFPVKPEEIDEYDHVSNLVYLRWTLRAAAAHSAAVGWTTERYRSLGQGWLVRSHKITYRRPALLGDEILMRTWVGDFERFSSVRHYRIFRAQDEVLLATAETNWVFVDLNSQQLARIPVEVQSAFGFVPQDETTSS